VQQRRLRLAVVVHRAHKRRVHLRQLGLQLRRRPALRSRLALSHACRAREHARAHCPALTRLRVRFFRRALHSVCPGLCAPHTVSLRFSSRVLL
jgi:hypothetical protein